MKMIAELAALMTTESELLELQSLTHTMMSLKRDFVGIMVVEQVFPNQRSDLIGYLVATPRRASARSRLAVVCPSVQLLERTQSCPSVQALRAHSELSVYAKLTGAYTL